MTIADTAREAAISLEVKKDGLGQRQDGSWLLRLRVHPNDDVTEIAAAPMGQRFMCCLVALADDETPLEQEKKKQNRLTQRAAILCGEKDFQNFLKHKFPMDWNASAVHLMHTEGESDFAEVAAEVVRERCGVRSRKEIVPGTEPAVAFEKLLGSYEAWRRL